jgi:vacuolar-type H+-ATPase subunit H
MLGSDSPLQVIKQRELDLRLKIGAARQQADTRIQAARAEAEQSIRSADEAGRAEAAASYQAGIEQAHREADGVTRAAVEEAGALRRVAMTRLDEAATQIVELVYAPFNGESPDHRNQAMP